MVHVRLQIRLNLWLFGGLALAAAISAHGAPPAQGVNQNEVKSKLSEVLLQSKLVRQAIGQLNRQVKVAFPESMVSEQSLYALQESAQILRKVYKTPPPPLFTRDQIRQIALSKAEGTPNGNQEEKRRLRKARDERKVEIENLSMQKSELESIVSEFRKQEALMQDLTNHISKHMLTPEVEFISRLNGFSVALSWGDLEASVLPAMAERLEVGETALRRLESLIAAASDDLKHFSEGIIFVEFLFPENGLTISEDYAGPNPMILPGQRIKELQQIISSTQAKAKSQADQLRKEAAEIRAANSRIDRLAGLLSLVGNLAPRNAVAVTGASAGTGVTAQPVKIYIRHENNVWNIRKPPVFDESNQPIIDMQQRH